MATNNRKSVTIEPKTNENGSMNAENAEKAPVKTTDEPKTQESIYTADQLANAYKTFDASYAIVATALKLAGKKEATVSEAKKIIEEFKNKEVK
jgi:hypothetical protein